MHHSIGLGHKKGRAYFWRRGFFLCVWMGAQGLMFGLGLQAQTTVPEPTTGSAGQWRSPSGESPSGAGSAIASGAATGQVGSGANPPAEATPSGGQSASQGALSPPPSSPSSAPSSPAALQGDPAGGQAAPVSPPGGVAPVSGAPGGAAAPSSWGSPSAPPQGTSPPGNTWSGTNPTSPPTTGSLPPGANPSSGGADRVPIARILPNPGTLPNEAGQIWREYDISPYTLRVHTTAKPELAVVDWILRETGYQAWHTEPLGILSVTPRTLRVYHTPQMQAVVAEIVDRFVNSAAQTEAFGLRVITVDHPNWRAKSYRVLRQVPVQTPGVQAWVLPREDAALLLADLRRRSDYREHNSPHLLIPNGQSTVVSSIRPRSFVRNVTLRSDTLQGYEQELSQIDEGFSVEFSPLVSLDGKMIDASIKCHIDMVERLVPVVIDVPTPTSPRQRVQIEVPQVSHFRFHERFRWPENQVLIVGLGVVPLPTPTEGQGVLGTFPLKLPGQSASRGELILMVESRGKQAESAPPTAIRPTYQNRY